MTTLTDRPSPASTNRRCPRPARLLLMMTPIILLLAACTSAAQDVVATEQPTEAAEPTAAPGEEPTAVPLTTPEPTADATEVAAVAPPPCDSVPAFSAADTVSIACSGNFAVSPELFASNAGWHLFEGQEGEWVEIDYARTCCEDDDVRFTQLLGRNGVNAATLTALCTASGLDSDPATGCVSGDPADDGAAFDVTWLRVNGLGEHDFGTSQDVVLTTIEEAFGPPESVTEASECGAGPMMIASFDDFTVQFQDDAMIGWYYQTSTPVLTTPSGVRVGITEDDLIEVYDGVEIRDDTLGREFVFEVPAGFMGGFISDDDATVTALYAGTNCFFR